MGRPRSARAHTEVLDAALELFAERGIDGTSMDAIADRSGVSKATIYKHWPDKDALCLEVLARVHGREPAGEPPTNQPAPHATGGSAGLRARMIAVLGHTPPERYAELRMRLMPHLMAYAARNPVFARAWRMRVLEPPRTELTRLLERAMDREILPRTLRIDVAIAQLLGPMMYGHVLRVIHHKTPDHLSEIVVDDFLRTHGRETTVTPPPREVSRPGSRRSPRRSPVVTGASGPADRERP